ncbi:MAG: hypothetical protein GF315_11825 [candidate division Zixibacteria bacterium]|nr:hypothetical protein [candidate division Zixibacteria bacterium]
MLLFTPGTQFNHKYSFILPTGKKNKKGNLKPGDTVKIPVIKGSKVTCKTSKDGKEMIVNVGF